MPAPKMIWEPDLAAHLAHEGAALQFISLGEPDLHISEVVGWFVIASDGKGEHRVLMRQRGGPRLMKTFDGVRKFLITYFPDSDVVSLPVVPQIRDPEGIFDLLEKMNS